MKILILLIIISIKNILLKIHKPNVTDKHFNKTRTKIVVVYVSDDGLYSEQTSEIVFGIDFLPLELQWEGSEHFCGVELYTQRPRCSVTVGIVTPLFPIFSQMELFLSPSSGQLYHQLPQEGKSHRPLSQQLPLIEGRDSTTTVPVVILKRQTSYLSCTA